MSYTILLVDDNEDLLDVLTRSLTKLGGYNTICAADGLAGLEQALTLKPDCIIIDVMMPKLNGYQLIRALRGDPDTATIPLVILTALTQDKDRFAGLAAGADSYLVKPVSTPDLVSAIQHAITTSEADRAQALRKLAEESE
jgi:CheY-like chemotaxis protein